MSSFLAAMLAIVIVSTLEFAVLWAVLPSKDSDPRLQGITYNVVVPSISGLAAFSAIWAYAYLISSWSGDQPSLLMVLLIGLYMSIGRLKQRGAQTDVGFIANLGLHATGIVLGAVISL